MKRITLIAAATAITTLLATAPAPGQYTYGAPDYNYDRGWYGTNNWFDTYDHYDYLYRTPQRAYSIPTVGPYSTSYGLYDYTPNEWSEEWDEDSDTLLPILD